jgi:capsular polysaccharide biosynthesis protein
MPSVFARGLQPELIGPNQRQVLSLAGVEPLIEAAPRATVRLAKCYVPTASFALGGKADLAHLLAPRRVAERLLGTVRRDARPVYLSRTEVASKRPHVGPLGNEQEFEARLAAHGVRVVHMQRHSLAEQIEIMNAHDVFIGPWGSALHNTLFSLRGREITTFVIVGGFNPTSFILVDSIVGNTAHYLMVLRQPPDFAEKKQHTIDIDAAIGYLRRHGVF